MNYIDSAIAAVPTANKEEYLAHAKQAAVVFKKHGALAITELWGNDVPEGKNNSLLSAVMCKEDETVVISYITWASKEARDTGWEKCMQDPELPQEMPFDGKRMIWGGFDVLMDA